MDTIKDLSDVELEVYKFMIPGIQDDLDALYSIDKSCYAKFVGEASQGNYHTIISGDLNFRKVNKLFAEISRKISIVVEISLEAAKTILLIMNEYSLEERDFPLPFPKGRLVQSEEINLQIGKKYPISHPIYSKYN